MASTWADQLPRVTVPSGAPKPVTFVYPYYCNAAFFARQVDGWNRYPADLLPSLSVIVVDDGSPDPVQKPATRCACRVFRIGVDVPWNWLAARNLGAHYAPEGWLLLTDMDHVVPEETLRAVITGAHDPAVAYAFARVDVKYGPIAPHSASFLLTRQRFWATGGYDETLSGHYGTDGEFRRRLLASGPVAVLPDVLVRHEYEADSSTQAYARKRPEDAVAVKRLIAARGRGWRPRVLSFPYTEVTA